MQLLRFALPAFLLSLISISLFAQDSQPVNTEAILKDLDVMEQHRAQIVQAARQAAIFKLQQAASSGAAATGFYADAVEAVQYEGKVNKATAFTDWRTANGDLFRDHDMQTMLMLHLKYLILSLQRADARQPDQFAVPALAYAKELFECDTNLLKLTQHADQIAADKQPSARDIEEKTLIQKVVAAKAQLLDQSVANGVFVKWLRLEDMLPKPADWELVPGNLGGILEKDVRPALRNQKNPQLVDTWNFEMQFLANRASSGRLEHAEGDFDNVMRPKLIFKRANDMALLGWNNRAVNEIYVLLKTYPQHADFDQWVNRLRELLKPVEPAAPAEAEESPAPEAAPSPPIATVPAASVTPAGISPQ